MQEKKTKKVSVSIPLICTTASSVEVEIPEDIDENDLTLNQLLYEFAENEWFQEVQTSHYETFEIDEGLIRQNSEKATDYID